MIYKEGVVGRGTRNSSPGPNVLVVSGGVVPGVCWARPPRGPAVVPASLTWSRCVRAAAQTEIPVLVGARLAAHLSVPFAVWCKQVRAPSPTCR